MFSNPSERSVSKYPSATSGANLNADIWDEGELWFASQLPRGWDWQPPRRDLGKDGLVVVRDDSELHNLEFAIQVSHLHWHRAGLLENERDREGVRQCLTRGSEPQSHHPPIVGVRHFAQETVAVEDP